jgi:hypothetical protein
MVIVILEYFVTIKEVIKPIPGIISVVDDGFVRLFLGNGF